MARQPRPPTAKTVELRFPGMGVVRSVGHERTYSAVDYPCVWSMNCRLADSLTSRDRGGSFTGISAGSRPSSIVYRDRTLTFSSNAVTASRVGDSSDTTLSADVSDMLRPAIFQFSEAAEQGSTVVALVPHKDQYLLCFTATETWVQQGDPLSGPRRRVSDQVGIVGPDAWCVYHDTVFFLSSYGLYSVSADGSGLKALSEDALPVELYGVSDATCTLTYQHSDRGVYIHTTGTDWYYDVENNAFWPFNTDSAQSHILLGPIRLGSVNEHGMIQTLTGIIAASSGTVTWHIITGNTAESVSDNGKLAITASIVGTRYDKYVASEGTWTAGRSHTSWPRVRSPWAVLWLSASAAWAYESVVIETLPSFGRVRI